MAQKELPYYTKGEEIFNAVTHIVGGAFGIVALVLSVIYAVIYKHDALGILSVVLYGVSMILLYTMSSIYHFLRRNKAKRVFRIFDHCTIYLLIAGTYSPMCLIVLRDTTIGLPLFIVVWVCAIIGITCNAINMYAKPIKILSMILYLLMGWAVIFGLKDLLAVFKGPGFYYLLAGGIAYTIGVVFYAFGKKQKYIHSIWHLFVLLGTILQFISIFFYVIVR
ncbi:MAG: hemolysin III family protein [Bacilli bacterium]|nr:hemolysin III family protein [Bacilli bacterium]